MPHASKIDLRFSLNAKKISVQAYPMARLLDVLREDCKVTGPKEGCGEGECGACSVMLNGVLVNSCLVPVIQVQDATVLTVEGLAIDQSPKKELSQIQKSFLECGGAQCGICTPGMLMALHALLEENPKPKRDDVKHAISGNLCRCTGYKKIVESVVSKDL